MSNEIPQEVLDAIARHIADGRSTNPVGHRVAQPVMQPIIYVPKPQPALPELPKFPAEEGAK